MEANWASTTFICTNSCRPQCKNIVALKECPLALEIGINGVVACYFGRNGEFRQPSAISCCNLTDKYSTIYSHIPFWGVTTSIPTG